jgi:transposase
VENLRWLLNTWKGREMITIPAVKERCAGIDVGKRGLAVVVMTGPADKEAVIQTRWVGTTVPELEALQEWLKQEGVTSVALESTGSYWIPVKNILENAFKLVLVCSKKHHPKKGDKTDFRDATQLAHLHRHGLLTGSYLPERGIVELRDFTRRRKKLMGCLASEKNRVQKVLETANVKIGNVIKDVFGVSGQEMLEALLSKRTMDVEEIAGMARTKLKEKIPQLIETLKGHHMNDHHRWLIQQSVDHLVFLDRQIEELEDRIMEKIEPYRKQFDLICTMPGFKEMNAAALLAEIGHDMSVFPSAGSLSKWAGVCSGNNRTAGRNKSGRVRKANKFLRCALGQAAISAARKKGCQMQRKFQRWVKTLGGEKAKVALGHNLLKVAWCLLKRGVPYCEPDTHVMHQMERQKTLHRCARQLLALGAEAAEVDAIVQQLASPVLAEEDQSPIGTAEAKVAEANQRDPRTQKCRSKPTSTIRGEVCRGKLGFRTRQTRKPVSAIPEHPDNRPVSDVSGQRRPDRRPRRSREAAPGSA